MALWPCSACHSPTRLLCLDPLSGLLAAFADLQHHSVAVPELLGAVGDQMRRGAAAQQEQLDLEAAAAAVASAGAAAAPEAAAAGAQAAAAGGPGQTAAARPAPPPPRGNPTEGFSIAGINSLVVSHLRLGYAPPPLLLQSLAGQIRRQLPTSSGQDAAALLQLLAAVPLNPGPAVVGLLLGRVLDEEAAAGGSSSSSGPSELAAEAQAAAARLLGGGSAPAEPPILPR